MVGTPSIVSSDSPFVSRARAAVRRLHDAGIGFTITSSRPTIGMRFLIEPLAITLPIGAFNGSCIVDPQLKPIEQRLIPPAAVRRSLDIMNEFGVDIWLFTSDLWLTRHPDGDYVQHEIRAIRADPTIVTDFAPYLETACKIVGSSAEGIDDAIKVAVGRASKTLHNLDWFEVSNIRGRIEDDQRCHFQVTLKVGFRLDEPKA